MFYLKLVLNFILRFFIILFFIFSLAAFYFGYTLLNFIVSVVITILFCVVYEIAAQKLQEKKGIKIASKKKFAEATENLILLSEKQLKNIFKNHLPENTFFYFNQKSFDNADFISFIKKLNEKGLTESTLCVNSITAETSLKLRSLENFKIDVLPIKEVYSVIEKNSIEIPTVIKLKSKAKFSVKQFGLLFFNKKLTKTYVMLGLFFMFYSIIVPFSLYYKIFSCIVFALGAACVFIPEVHNISRSKN